MTCHTQCWAEPPKAASMPSLLTVGDECEVEMDGQPPLATPRCAELRYRTGHTRGTAAGKEAQEACQENL